MKIHLKSQVQDSVQFFRIFDSMKFSFFETLKIENYASHPNALEVLVTLFEYYCLTLM